ncbi:MAG: guanylate kinase, partial [Bdellovibrionales bacterium RIFOXYD1_FULL_44_7]
MKKLIVLSAPSGAGKTTLCSKLLKDFPELELSISTTTRQPRGQEQNGKEYFFTNKEEFETDIAADRFAEWAVVHENYYGTSKRFIEEVFSRNKNVLLDIDVQGAESLRKTYPNECYSFFIAPPSMKVLEKRLRDRKTDSEPVILKRLENAKLEMQ